MGLAGCLDDSACFGVEFFPLVEVCNILACGSGGRGHGIIKQSMKKIEEERKEGMYV